MVSYCFRKSSSRSELSMVVDEEISVSVPDHGCTELSFLSIGGCTVQLVICMLLRDQVQVNPTISHRLEVCIFLH